MGDNMKRQPSFDNMQIVPEEMIRYCAAQIPEDADNTFSRFLKIGVQLRNAGLTPIFICSDTLQDLMVTTEERLQKKLH
jgi:hypothetical protein